MTVSFATAWRRFRLSRRRTGGVIASVEPWLEKAHGDEEGDAENLDEDEDLK